MTNAYSYPFFLMEKYMTVYTPAIESMTYVCVFGGGGYFVFTFLIVVRISILLG